MTPILSKIFHKHRPKSDDPQDIGWINLLPRDNCLSAQDIILQRLSGIVPVEMPLENWRIQALLVIDARCRGNVAMLEHQYVAVQKLRSELDEHMWGAVYTYYRYLARGYQAFINDYVKHADQTSFDHRYLPLIVARAIHNNASIAKWRYMRYQAMPDGGWLAMHRLYALAESEGFGNKPLQLYEGQLEVTPGERYAQALMLDSFNRTNMTKRQIDMVDGWLARWLKGVSIARNFDDRQFLFYAELGQDQGARRIRNFKATPSCRYWETDTLVESIDHARKLLEEGKSMADAGLGNACSASAATVILKQLFAEWSRTEYQRQRRSEDRREVMTTATVAKGVPEVWQQVKDVAASLNRKAGGYVPVEGKSLEERLAAHSVAAKGGGPIIAFPGVAGERWMINDASQSGFGAIVGAEVANWVEIGRLVALVCDENRDEVAVGVVRSIKQRLDGRRHIGVEVLSRAATSIQLTNKMPRAATNTTGDVYLDANLLNPAMTFMQGLLLPPDKARGLGETMLLPNAEFDPGGMYEVSQGASHHMVRFGQTIEQKDDWIRLGVETPGHA